MRRQAAKALTAAVAGLALLTGGNVVATWMAEDRRSDVIYTSGTLEVALLTEEVVWKDQSPDRLDAGRTIDLATDRIVPGDVIQGHYPLDVDLKGKNLATTLSVNLDVPTNSPLLDPASGFSATYTVQDAAKNPVWYAHNLQLTDNAVIKVATWDNDTIDPSEYFQVTTDGPEHAEFTVVITVTLAGDTHGTVATKASAAVGNLNIDLEQVPIGSADLDNALFHADIAAHGHDWYGHIASYLAEGTDYGITPDPAGSGRSVLWMDPTTMGEDDDPWPIMDTAYVMTPGGAYWTEFSFYLPSASAITVPGTKSTISVGAKGYPWGSHPPLEIVLDRPDITGSHRLVLEDKGAPISSGADVPLDTWVTVTMNFKAAEDGWVQMWVDSGTGPQRLQINGEDRPAFEVVRPGVNDGGNLYSEIGIYGTHTGRIYYGDHAIGTTQTSANIDGTWVPVSAP